MAASRRLPIPGVRAWIDAVAYAVTLTAMFLVGAAVVTALTGGDGARVNALLFVSGWALMAYATFKLWPSAPPTEDDEEGGYREALPAVHNTRWQRVARAMTPVRWIQLPPPEARISVRGQQFLASVTVLVTSFLLEQLLGVA